MAKLVYVLVENTDNIQDLISSKIVSSIQTKSGCSIVARFNVNKSALKKLSNKLEAENG